MRRYNMGVMAQAKQISGSHPSLDQILDTLRPRLSELRKEYGVKNLGVFGSYVRGQQRKRSDVDLLVEFEFGGLNLLHESFQGDAIVLRGC